MQGCYNCSLRAQPLCRVTTPASSALADGCEHRYTVYSDLSRYMSLVCAQRRELAQLVLISEMMCRLVLFATCTCIACRTTFHYLNTSTNGRPHRPRFAKYNMVKALMTVCTIEKRLITGRCEFDQVRKRNSSSFGHFRSQLLNLPTITTTLCKLIDAYLLCRSWRDKRDGSSSPPPTIRPTA